MIFEQPEWTKNVEVAEFILDFRDWMWGSNWTFHFVDWFDSYNVYDETDDRYYTDLERLKAYFVTQIARGDMSFYNIATYFTEDNEFANVNSNLLNGLYDEEL